MKKFPGVLVVSLLFLCSCTSTDPQEQEQEEIAPEEPQAEATDEAGEGEEGEETEPEDPLSSGTFSALKFRSIGPALMSGRIGDIAVDPTDSSTWYLAVASGNVWKTSNAGTTWKPIFEKEGAYAIGCVTVDPRNPSVVWVGTGENNAQRSVGYGDGVYKSLDGGRSWKNVGLAESAHIGRIAIDPRDSDTVWVAAQGPLWAAGGERGLYRTTDGGETWNLALEISEDTGVTDVLLDPRDPDLVYAASWQRRRHVGLLIGGGPESAIHRSTDGGETWERLKKGLPGGDVGRIGLALSPQDPDVVYAAVEAAGEGSGFYRSPDRGAHWEKRSGYYCSCGPYYGEIFADPHQFDRVYAMDTYLHVSDDGGKTFTSLAADNKHVDNHAIAFDPDDPEHLLIGTDGGLYETWDRCETFRHKPNLPLTQFYRLGLDEDFPFYNVYGGTQDNSTLGGPSRTNNSHGILNRDWFITIGGDGFQPRIDPTDPNILYSQYQYAGLVRFDRASGERVEIQPQPEPGEPAVKWHWNSPLLISPHNHTRLYFAGDRLFRSDDRGDRWSSISPDLSRGIDRNELELMGRLWSVDSVSRHLYSSFYGTIVSLDESPLIEGLIYVGTDDGLIQVTEDGGDSWRRVEGLPGLPELAYSSDVVASLHDADTVFAVFENHKRGDFAPYLFRSTDRGRTWTSIAGDLPEDQPVWALVQDHVREDLFFAATEFGVFFTLDGGGKWIALKSGLPTIAVRDLEIQRREDDLVLATFGRGFYVLDDYSPLREVSAESLEEDVTLFPVKKTWWYVQANPLGGGQRGSQGDSYYVAENPPYGAVFTYYLKEGLKTRKQQRRKEEGKLAKKGESVPFPDWDDLRAEDREEKPVVILTVTDENGEVVRRLTGPTGSGMHRVAWDLRFPAYSPVRLGGGEGDRARRGSSGPLTLPGRYTVSLAQRVDGVTTPLGAPQTFETVSLGLATLPAENREAVLAFQQELGELQRALSGAGRVLDQSLSELELVRHALDETPGVDSTLADVTRDLEQRFTELQVRLAGDPTVSRRQEPTPPSLQRRLGRAASSFSTTGTPTKTQTRGFEIVAAEFGAFLEDLRLLVDVELANLETALEEAHVPWTPRRGVPRWRKE